MKVQRGRRIRDRPRLCRRLSCAHEFSNRRPKASIPEGGSEQTLIAIFKVAEAEKRVKEILHEREYAVQIERHAESQSLRAPQHLGRIWL